MFCFLLSKVRSDVQMNYNADTGEFQVSGSGEFTADQIIELFPDGKNYTSLKITGELTSIPLNAFNESYDLVSVTITAPIENIDNYSFYYCAALTTITMPDTVKTLGESTFERCSHLSSFIIPPLLKVIPKKCFYRCDALTEIDFRDVTTIGDSAFSGSGIKKLQMTEKIEIIEQRAFMLCRSLTDVTFSPLLTTLSENLFSFTPFTNLTIPENVKRIEALCFYNCLSLQYLEFLGEISFIGESFISRDNLLTTIKFNEFIEEIHPNAFIGAFDNEQATLIYCGQRIVNSTVLSERTALKVLVSVYYPDPLFCGH